MRQAKSEKVDGEMRAVREMKAGLFQALANPTRIHIVECLFRGHQRPRDEVPVSELLERVNIGAANLSQHLNVLRGKGLVVSRKEGTQVYCQLRDRRIAKVLDIMKGLCESDLEQSLASFAAAERVPVSIDKAGVPSFVTGELGFVDSAAGLDLNEKSLDSELFSLSVKNFLQGFAVDTRGAAGSEEFEATRVRQDKLGKVHTRFHQYINGMRVVGAELIVHSDAKSGAVYAVNGNFARDAGVPGPRAANKIGFKGGLHGDLVGDPELLYFHDAVT